MPKSCGCITPYCQSIWKRSFQWAASCRQQHLRCDSGTERKRITFCARQCEHRRRRHGALDLGSNSHSVTSGTSCTEDDQFCSPNNMNCEAGILNNTGFVYEFTFTQSGIYQYFCHLHCFVGMTGVVNVRTTHPMPRPRPTPAPRP